MNEREHPLLLGVDGGGSSTVAWLATHENEGTQIVGRGCSGPSNPRVAGFSDAINNLHQAIHAAFSDSGRDRVPVASACLAMAGADRPGEQAQLRSWAEATQLADRLSISNDALPVLYAATEDGIGIALISGTGSVAIGRDASGHVLRCGGWGPLLGDEGSGYQIALAGLRAAARQADGRGPRTMLLERFVEHFQLDQSMDLIPTVYCQSMGRREIACLATQVFEVALSGDTVAEAIISRAAVELSALVTTVVDQLSLSKPVVLAVTGGVLLNQPAFVSSIVQRLVSSGLEIKLHKVDHPVVGAVRMAHQQWRT